jgi:hypothetical protein
LEAEKVALVAEHSGIKTVWLGKIENKKRKRRELNICSLDDYT